jgi:hypothetical protein
MATTIYTSIKSSLITLFKGLYPTFDVFCEDIAKTQNEEPEPDLEDYIFLDIIPTGNTTVGPYHTDRRVLVDAALHTKSESNDGYLAMTQELDSTLRPVFRFEDGGEARAITVQDLTFKVVDRVLHCTFTLAFRDSVELPPQPPVMEELETTINTSKGA